MNVDFPLSDAPTSKALKFLGSFKAFGESCSTSITGRVAVQSNSIYTSQMVLRTVLPLLSRVMLDWSSTIVIIVIGQVVGLLKFSCTRKFPLDRSGSKGGSVPFRVEVKS